MPSAPLRTARTCLSSSHPRVPSAASCAALIRGCAGWWTQRRQWRGARAQSGWFWLSLSPLWDVLVARGLGGAVIVVAATPSAVDGLGVRGTAVLRCGLQKVKPLEPPLEIGRSVGIVTIKTGGSGVAFPSPREQANSRRSGTSRPGPQRSPAKPSEEIALRHDHHKTLQKQTLTQKSLSTTFRISRSHASHPTAAASAGLPHCAAEISGWQRCRPRPRIRKSSFLEVCVPAKAVQPLGWHRSRARQM
jgi:hypothetical protein